MRLTTFTDYSLRVLMFVATAPEGRATIAEVARSFDISEHHLVKVVHALGTSGLLNNQRGRGGGLRLGRAPREINVGHVVRITEGMDFPAECFGRNDNHCVLTPACRLAGVLERALEAFYAVLDGYTLEDLVANRKDVTAILHRFTPALA
ncbi:MAG TPA: Rrf2 family transcriptional regulator [Usitatibacter sp.]|nr:Rrf2 family transcriptional regulator [Usitatibacter sp.]